MHNAKSRLRGRCAKILLLLMACVPAIAGAVEPRYRAVQMGSVYSGVSESYGVGSHGAIAVLGEFDGTTFYAAVYHHDYPLGGVESLPDGEHGKALDVNGAMDVVGMAHDDGDFIYKAVLWPHAGGKIVIPTPRPGNASKAVAINDAGRVTGQLTINDKKSRCFVWSQDRGYSDLGQPPAGTSCEPAGINNHGQVTGSVLVDGHETAFVWKKGTFQLLPHLPSTDGCHGTSINDHGDVVGSCTSEAPAHSHPVLWRNGVAIDLYPFDDLQNGVAVGIDDAGTIVGSLATQTSTRYAVVFDGQGGVTDLHDLVRDGQNLLFYAPGGISKNGMISSGEFKLIPLAH